eukprot:1479642-Prymnesium_polylepis.1
MGAYRFVDQPTDEGGGWSYIYTPLVAALVENALRLHYLPYEPGDPKSHMKKVLRSHSDARCRLCAHRTV